MTGDGAVVRDQYAEAEWDFRRCLPFVCNLDDDVKDHLAHELAIKGFPSRPAYERQAAEIERLTGDLKSALSREKTMTKTAMVIVARAEASEARTADLLKYIEGRDHADYCPLSDDDSDPEFDETEECTCGFDTAIAAAKGETV